MEAIKTPEFPYAGPIDLERAELEWLLTSGVLGRAVSLIRVLKYLCDEHFQGRADRLKEYSIAVEALGRRVDFDPQTDTIVRVTVHALRKRLLEIYRHEGAKRPLRLVIPPGRYAPLFLRSSPEVAFSMSVAEPPSVSLAIEAKGSSPLSISQEDGRVIEHTSQRFRPRSAPMRIWMAVGLIVVTIAAVSSWVARHEMAKKVGPSAFSDPVTPPATATVRALMGTTGRTYVDHSGNIWATGNFCQGGTDVSVPAQRIQGTEDATLYLNGVRGIAHCVFPVKPGLHEIHFYFAETSDLQAATNVATLSINAAPAMDIDVVDNAGGDGIATSTVVTGVAPENDGAIHVDFTSEVSLLNAVEILQAPSAKQLPVRIVASSKPILDSANQTWKSDRYFSGGRHGQSPDSAQQAKLGVYASDRIGRFRYTIPAVPLARYHLRLYFHEPWFGRENGGPGSRVFDVACNGAMILKNFDILAESGSQPITKTFDVQASPSGRIELAFMPVVNYPVVSAIEVVAY